MLHTNKTLFMKHNAIHTFAALLAVLLFTPHNVWAHCLSSPPDKDPNEKIFKAGAATSNITPFLGGGLVGNFGTPPPAKNVHDELHARSLILYDGATKLVFVIVDNISMKRNLMDKAKQIIEEEIDIPSSHVLIATTHTHSSVSAGGEGAKRRMYADDSDEFDDYQQFVIRRIADAVQMAHNNLQPAQIGWGAGSVPQHVFVRRWIMKEPVINPFGKIDKVVFNPGRNPNILKPASTPDPEVSFISVQSVSGTPIALLANYSLHYVGGTPRNDISADYFGVFANRIGELLNATNQQPQFVGIMSNGTSGDVNNVNVVANNSPNPPARKQPYEQMKLVAEEVAQEVLRVHNSIEFHDWVSLQAEQQELPLQVRKASASMLQKAKEVRTRPDSVQPIHQLELTYANRIINMHKEWPDSISCVLQTFRIGNLGISAIPFEVFAETGMELKAKSPLQHTFTIELANGSYGYLPTPEQHQLGGYETWYTTNRVEIDASRKIVAKLLSMFHTIQNE